MWSFPKPPVPWWLGLLVVLHAYLDFESSQLGAWNTWPKNDYTCMYSMGKYRNRLPGTIKLRMKWIDTLLPITYKYACLSTDSHVRIVLGSLQRCNALAPALAL